MVKIGVADKSLPIGNKLAKPRSFAGSKSLCQPPKLISKKKKIMFAFGHWKCFFVLVLLIDNDTDNDV